MVGIWYVRPDGHMVGIVRSDFHLEAECVTTTSGA